MLSLFVLLSVVFLAVAMLGEQSAMVAVGRNTRTSPLLFLVVAMYFENRFEFYDLIVKRGVMLRASRARDRASSVAIAGSTWLDAIPAGSSTAMAVWPSS